MDTLSHPTKETKSQSRLLIFLAWLVYTTSYLGKVNYSANITQIIDYYAVTKTQAGTVPTFFFFAYGIGQVINGLFCKKYPIKWMVFGSLLASGLINLTIAVTSDFSVIKWLWLANGFVLSVLWPTLIRLLSESLPQKMLGTSSVVMGTTVALGTLTIYGLSSVYASFDKFKLAFYTAAFAVFGVSAVWLLLYRKAVTSAKEERTKDASAADVKTGVSDRKKQKTGEKKVFLASVCAICFCAVGVNLIKDGLTTWVPSILKESFSMSDSLSILLTLFLPVVAVFGNVFALKIHQKIPDYVNHCGAVFVLIFVLVGVIIGSLTLQLAAVMLIALVIVSFLASSLNSLITGIYPLFMREKVNSGLFAGILNAFCYLGSTISSYGLGTIADRFGWVSVFRCLLGFCTAVFLVWGVYVCIKGRMRKRI